MYERLIECRLIFSGQYLVASLVYCKALTVKFRFCKTTASHQRFLYSLLVLDSALACFCELQSRQRTILWIPGNRSPGRTVAFSSANRLSNGCGMQCRFSRLTEGRSQSRGLDSFCPSFRPVLLRWIVKPHPLAFTSDRTFFSVSKGNF